MKRKIIVIAYGLLIQERLEGGATRATAPRSRGGPLSSPRGFASEAPSLCMIQMVKGPFYHLYGEIEARQGLLNSFSMVQGLRGPMTETLPSTWGAHI